MSEKTFTSEDYERELASYVHKDFPADQVTLAALRGMANAMKPGLIEATIERYTGPDPTGIVAAAIRRALTETDNA